MMPGRMNPRQMERMMRKMGLNLEEMNDVKEVVIFTESKEIHITRPSVTVMEIQGEKNFQIQGKVHEKTIKPQIPREDIDIVIAQTGVSEEDALKALEECGGEPAEAIIRLIG